MKRFPWGGVRRGAAVLVCVVVLLLWSGRGRSQEHGNATGTESVKTAEQQFKNIQVLKGIPADQLIPSMQFISGALGVGCDFCHVGHQMDKDGKKTKQTARKMITMQLAIDKNDFDSAAVVTCYTCHRGSAHPVSTPILSADMSKVPKPAAGAMEHDADEYEDANLPKADAIFDKYLAAVGGANAVQKIKTRVQKGNIETPAGKFPIEVFSEAPEKRVSVTQMQSGPSVTGFNGQVGWLTIPGGVHKMSAAEGEAARIDAAFYFPVKVREMYQVHKVRSGEEVGGRPTIQVEATAKGKPTMRLLFDQENGLLLRQIRYAETPLGKNPTQIDYADYRDADGVKIPYQWTLARPGGAFTIRIDQMQQNVPVDEKLFVVPAEEPAKK
jgi:photosynthetic reaction center cytochrome c subunit